MPLNRIIDFKTILLRLTYPFQPSFKTEKPRNTNSITHQTTQNFWINLQNQDDPNNLLNFLSTKDFPTHLRNQRPNTKWVLERIVNLQIHVFPTTYPLGNPPKLPDYIRNNRHIIALEKDQHHGYRYKDHLCFFRCLAFGRFGKTYHNCNGNAKELFNQYCKHFQVTPDEFKGI